MNSATSGAVRVALHALCCLLTLSCVLSPTSVHCTPTPPLKVRDVRVLKRLIHRVERGLSPQGRSRRRATQALLKTIPLLERVEDLFARYLHSSSPKSERGAALRARSLVLSSLHVESGLFFIHGGRLCLRPEHRANLAGLLLTQRQPRQAIEQLQRGASCSRDAQPFWDEAYLIARDMGLTELQGELSLRASQALKVTDE